MEGDGGRGRRDREGDGKRQIEGKRRREGDERREREDGRDTRLSTVRLGKLTNQECEFM